tara:strand:- start:111 stop:1283 length:1173 start_codon:yes stop_codon:yes gene_type:complete
MSEIKVNSIKGVAASTAALTINNTDGTCTANLSNRQNRNLIINGAMNVAQRGTSGTGYGYIAVDRFRTGASQVDENPTTAQVDVASGTTPYTNGFTKAIKITNGNQTGGAGTGDSMNFTYRLEAQDIRNSGWNYLSSSSYITLSFWCKSSVAQTFFGRLYTTDGTAYNYPFSMGSLSADTWTKITKTIPGNSNLTFDNNADQGLAIEFTMFNGTAKTDSGVALDTWAAYNTATRQPDNTSTWYTTNDSTWELTGVQLEVGSVATDFEHRSFAVEKRLCMRYYQQEVNPQRGGGRAGGTANKGELHPFFFPVEMRSTPTVSLTNTGSSAGQYVYDDDSYANMSSLDSSSANPISCHINYTLSGDLTDGSHLMLGGASSTSHETTYKFNAEL